MLNMSCESSLGDLSCPRPLSYVEKRISLWVALCELKDYMYVTANSKSDRPERIDLSRPYLLAAKDGFSGDNSYALSPRCEAGSASAAPISSFW